MGQACYKTSHNSNQSHQDHVTNHEESPAACSEVKISLDLPCSQGKIVNMQQLDDKCLTAPFNASQEDIREFYEFEEEILGSGKFGVVRKASLLCFPTRFYAIKSIPMSKLHTPQIQYLLQMELHCLQTLHHPNIVRFFECYQDFKFVHIVTEYLEGGDLLNYLSIKKKLPEKEAFHIIDQLLDAIFYLHEKGICHRDIKPENILFTEGNHKNVKLIDFGLACKMQGNEEKKFNFLAGSPLYIAPEIVSGEKYGSNCDCWSLGILLYFMLFGKTPFYEENYELLFSSICNAKIDFPNNSSVSEEAQDLISKLLQRNPAERIELQRIKDHDWYKKFDVVEEKKNGEKSVIEAMEIINQREENLIKNCVVHIMLNLMEKSEWNDIYIKFKSLFNKEKGWVEIKKEGDNIIKLDLFDFAILHLKALNKLSFDSFPEIVDTLDIDHCGGLSFQDFKTLSIRQGIALSERKFYEKFTMFSPNSAKISFSQIESWFFKSTN